MSGIGLVNVFTHGGQGGNPCPIAIDAAGWRDEEMQAVAQRFGHESGFVLPAASADFDYTFRFWVPRHEMEMCGHATIGALWCLAMAGRLDANQVRIATRSGPVTGYVGLHEPGDPSIEISQPVGKVVDLARGEEEDVLATLGLSRHDLLDLPIQNAVTSRVKTLIPMKSPEHLNGLASDMARTETCCERIGSTGLYPYAIDDQAGRRFEARQFPKSSGYPEDAATGIAAAAWPSACSRTGWWRATAGASRSSRGGRWDHCPRSASVWASPRTGRSVACWEERSTSSISTSCRPATGVWPRRARRSPRFRNETRNGIEARVTLAVAA